MQVRASIEINLDALVANTVIIKNKFIFLTIRLQAELSVCYNRVIKNLMPIL